MKKFTERTIYLVHQQCGSEISINFELLRQHIKGKFYLICSCCFKNTLERSGASVFFDDILVTSAMSKFDEIASLISETTDTQSKHFDILSIDETTVSLCGKLKKHFGLQSFDHESYVDKLVMKQHLSKSEVNLPRHMPLSRQTWLESPSNYFNHITSNIPFPCFIKPINLAGAVKAIKLDDEQALSKWLNEWEEDGYIYEIDEYIDGTLFHCESIINKGEIVYSQVFEYSTPCYNIKLGVPLGSISVEDDHPDQESISALNQQVHQLLAPIQNGVTHLEVFKKPDGTLVFLEIAYRPPGNLASEMYLKRCNIPLKEMHVIIQVDPDTKLDTQNIQPVARYIFPLPGAEGEVLDYTPLDIHSNYQTFWNYQPGDKLTTNCGLCKNAGKMLLWNSDVNRLRNDFATLHNHFPYQLKQEHETVVEDDHQ